MTETEKTIEYGGEELTIRAVEGQLEGGELKVSKVSVHQGDKAGKFDLDEPISFDEVTVPLLVTLLGERVEHKNKWDTADRTYTEPRHISAGSDEAAILQIATFNAPTTTSELNKIIEDDVSVRNAVYKLKDKDLLAVIGYEGNAHVIVPTHLGWKETLTMMGPDMNMSELVRIEGDVNLNWRSDEEEENTGGLYELFDETSVRDPNGEDSEE